MLRWSDFMQFLSLDSLASLCLFAHLMWLCLTSHLDFIWPTVTEILMFASGHLAAEKWQWWQWWWRRRGQICKGGLSSERKQQRSHVSYIGWAIISMPKRKHGRVSIFLEAPLCVSWFDSMPVSSHREKIMCGIWFKGVNGVRQCLEKAGRLVVHFSHVSGWHVEHVVLTLWMNACVYKHPERSRLR